MSTERKAPVRCAVYTRKSSEEGLEQSFNSLDAQREACHAYILSQRQEGWRAIDAQSTFTCFFFAARSPVCSRLRFFRVSRA
jgi:hypothetical protein